VKTKSVRPVVLRNGVAFEDPFQIVLGFLEAWRIDGGDRSRPERFDEADLRLANRDGARISAVEIASILERRRMIEQALQAIASDASLVVAAAAVPFRALTRRDFDSGASFETTPSCAVWLAFVPGRRLGL
jgi:hypothetical protein